MKKIIVERLYRIEAEEDVLILFACESGSRAWGFPSADSDYDVRFLYVRPLDWYLSIEEKRDVIEVPIEGDLDIGGWDIKKALRLFRKSNPPLFEWLQSPIVYLERGDIAARMRTIAQRYYSPVACIYHYLHMAKGNFRQYLKGDKVKTKKYFYVLRPLFAIKWIEAGFGVAPTSFETLLDKVDVAHELKDVIRGLIKLKQQGNELDYGDPIPIIAQFIEQELARLEQGVDAAPNAAPLQEMDQIFRHCITMKNEG